MTHDPIEKIIDGVLEREKGYVNDPTDRGGPTNRGITLRTLEAWRKRPVTIDELKALTEGEAREIYRHDYIERPGFLRVKDLLLRELLVDMEVNHRPGVAAKSLQRALGVTVDGIIGPKTIAALEGAHVPEVYREVAAQRVELYGRIIEQDRPQAKYAAGWAVRAAGFVRRIPVPEKVPAA